MPRPGLRDLERLDVLASRGSRSPAAARSGTAARVSTVTHGAPVPACSTVRSAGAAGHARSSVAPAGILGPAERLALAAEHGRRRSRDRRGLERGGEALDREHAPGVGGGRAPVPGALERERAAHQPRQVVGATRRRRGAAARVARRSTPDPVMSHQRSSCDAGREAQRRAGEVEPGAHLLLGLGQPRAPGRAHRARGAARSTSRAAADVGQSAGSTSSVASCAARRLAVARQGLQRRELAQRQVGHARRRVAACRRRSRRAPSSMPSRTSAGRVRPAASASETRRRRSAPRCLAPWVGKYLSRPSWSWYAGRRA